MIRNYYDNCKNELINLIINDDMINGSIYNYNDIEKLLFKYELRYDNLLISDRDKLNNLLSENIKRYKKEYRKKVIDDIE